ncbi:MAG: recombinase family protein [Clostridiales bacterium]|nr:recombinase family protein [Clostridiales bacterium]
METGIYVRVSTEEQAQEGYSIRGQEDKLKCYAQIKDWSIYKIYIDEGISGKNLTDRPAVQEMLADVKKGNIKNVLVYKIDRLTRNTADLIYMVDLFNSYDCAFNSLMESIDTHTASGRMFLKIVGIFAEFERENIIERVKFGRERKVKEGYSLCTWTICYGYDRPKGQKVQTINEIEAEIVRDIFDLYVNQGITITDIARRLNIRKAPIKSGASWKQHKVRGILENPTYIGQVRHHVGKENSYTVDGLHEPIITQELFDMAQRLLAKIRKVSPSKNPNPEKYFTGFLVCAHCGEKLGAYNAKTTHTNGAVYYSRGYRCANRTLRSCVMGSIAHGKVEKAFEEYIAQVSNFDVASDIRQSELEQKKQNNLELIDSYEKKLRQLEEKEREALSLYVNNLMDFDSYREVKMRVDKDKQSICAELERLQEIQVDVVIDEVDIISQLNDNWVLLSNTEKRLFLMQFVDRITLDIEKGKGKHLGTAKIIDIVFKAA